jgi:hypothetical protein
MQRAPPNLPASEKVMLGGTRHIVQVLVRTHRSALVRILVHVFINWFPACVAESFLLLLEDGDDI